MMGRLTFVGLGLGARGISLEGVVAIREADTCYLEYYTTPHEPTLLKELENETGRVMTVVDREFVEDGREILKEARDSRVVLAVPGDPMIATTHNDLRVRAIGQKTETAVVHAATITSSAASASGLHYYKFGRTITITRETLDMMQQAYHTIQSNLLQGLHTLLLLEFDVQDGEGAAPQAVFEGLLSAEKNFRREVLSEETFALVLSRIGRKDPELRAGYLKDLRKTNYGEQPHCVVIPGGLHFTEIEAVAAIFGIGESEVRDNSRNIKGTAEVLIPRYAAKTRKALNSVRGKLGPEYDAVLENVELYMKDAEGFLSRGELELAMLSMGYAEGLLDSAGFTGKAKIDW
ncbi:MAG TPA: diphthine synthase [Nitrososphaerales archaeon]|nr:diphthine synthase [Nitrososphaerales archaeon]